MSEDKEKLSRYEVLELLARLANYKGITYEVDEIKDGRIISIKNVKIDKVTLQDRKE